MRKALCLTAASFAVAAASHAVDPVFSDPVGFVKLGNTAADGTTTPAVPANTDVFLTIPLETSVAFTGTVASTTATTITVNGTPTWGANDWVPASGAPYAAIIGSGTEEGLRGMISANTGDTLTLTVTTPGDLTAVANGDTVRIRPCWTLQSFFADAIIGNDSEVLVFDETAAGVNHSSAENFLFFDGSWYDGNFNPANDRVLHPGETFILRSSGAPIPTLTIFGDVPLAAHRIDVSKDAAGAEDIEIGLQSPVPNTVGALGIPAENDDEILLFSNVASGVNKSSAVNLLFFDGSWYDGNFNDVTNTQTIEPGAGFILRRAPASTTLAQEWFKTSPAP